MGTPDLFEPEGPGSQIEPQGEQLPDGPEVVDGEHVPPERRIEVQAQSHSGPLPAPRTLDEYDRVVPGLAQVIVDQWKAETAHRHETITSMRKTDHEAMTKYYEGERQGRLFGFLGLLGLLAVAALAVVLNRQAVGVASLFTAGAGAIWAIRRNSNSKPEPPVQVDDGDSVEDPESHAGER